MKENGLQKLFKAICMPMNINCYETSHQLHQAVVRAYFAGRADALNEDKIIE